jgi:hypothetical protein
VTATATMLFTTRIGKDSGYRQELSTQRHQGEEIRSRDNRDILVGAHREQMPAITCDYMCRLCYDGTFQHLVVGIGDDSFEGIRNRHDPKKPNTSTIVSAILWSEKWSFDRRVRSISSKISMPSRLLQPRNEPAPGIIRQALPAGS